MHRPTMIRFAFLLLAFALTALAGFPAAPAEALTCCQVELQNCTDECAPYGGVAEFEGLPFGGSCKFYCACNF